jgi:hypothetical protein
MKYVCQKGQPRQYSNVYFFLWVQVGLQRKLSFSHSTHQLRKSRQHESVDVRNQQVRQKRKDNIIKRKFEIYK